MSTALPTLAVEQRIQAVSFEVGISAAQLASYVGVHRTSLSEKIMTGTVGDDLGQKILETLDVMKQLRYKAGLPISWDQVVLCRPVVEQALAEFREAKDPCPDTFYVLNLGSRGYFVKVRNGEVISMPSIAQAAAFSSLDQAGVATRELNFRFKERADWIPVPNHGIKRPMSQMVSSFEEVGLSGVPGPKPQ
jgi:hypothetical protein